MRVERGTDPGVFPTAAIALAYLGEDSRIRHPKLPGVRADAPHRAFSRHGLRQPRVVPHRSVERAP